MRLHTRSISGLAVAVSLSVAVVASAPASSGLNPNWTLFNETTNAPLTSSDVIDASGSETFQGTIGGVLRAMKCSYSPTTFPLSVSASGTLSGPPGSVLTLTRNVPTTVDCFSGTLRVRVTKSGTWTLKLTLPPAGTTPGQLFNGTVSGSLTVPANGFTADLSQLCAGTTVTGPTTAKTFTGSSQMRV